MSDLDIDPRRSPLSRLMGIIQKLNADLLCAKVDLAREQQRADREHRLLQQTTRRHHDLIVKYLCDDCQHHIRSTPPGDTISFCDTCNDTRQTVQSLRSENQRLRSELATRQES